MTEYALVPVRNGDYIEVKHDDGTQNDYWPEECTFDFYDVRDIVQEYENNRTDQNTVFAMIVALSKKGIKIEGIKVSE